MLIGLAGPMFNFLLTLALMLFYYGFINEVPSATVKTTTVEWITPGSTAAAAGLETGDVILSFDKVKNPDWEAVYEHARLNANQMVPVTVQPGYPAEQAGLRAGDAIEAVDSHAFHSVSTLLAYMQWEKGKPLTLDVLRNGATLQIVATPAKIDTLWKLGFATKPTPIRDEPLSLLSAWNKSLGFFKANSLVVVEVLDRLFTHRISVTQLMGPVGIAQAAGEAAETNGWYPKFGLAGMISLNLGILNLLPFPILDGGMILLLLIESALRHDISLAIKERIYQAAFVVLMAFMAFTIFNDVSKLPLFMHIKP